jgi:hypothetical protein
MTSCTVVARAKIRTAGAAGWDRSPAYLPILACLAGSVLLHACMRRPVSRSGLLGEPVDGSIGVGDDGWPSSTRRPLRTYAVPLSSAYPPASSPAATKLRMLVLCLGPIGGYGGAGPEAAAPLPPTRAAARGASPPTILAHTSLVRATQ